MFLLQVFNEVWMADSRMTILLVSCRMRRNIVQATPVPAASPRVSALPKNWSLNERGSGEYARSMTSESFWVLKVPFACHSVLLVLNNKLAVLKSFNEWNSDPDIARAAEGLYRNIDNLELYVSSPCRLICRRLTADY
jgi:hypothetical protein